MKILSGRVALRLVGPLLFVGTWELLSRLGWVRADFIPAPHAVAVAGLELARSGELAGHIRASAFRAASRHSVPYPIFFSTLTHAAIWPAAFESCAHASAD